MPAKRKPDNEVSEFALYYREYRRKKKAGEFIPKPGRPREEDESKLAQNPHAKYMRKYMRKKADEKRKNSEN